jgi:DNA-binding NarL/FixJ family response regulator
MSEPTPFDDVIINLSMHAWSSASAEFIARQRPAFVVIELSGVPRPGLVEKISALSKLGVLVIALINGGQGLEELCLRAGATPIVQTNRELNEIVEILAIVEHARRIHRTRAPRRAPGHRRASDLERIERPGKGAAGLSLLTRQEQNVLAALMDGQAVREIAISNVLSPLTVRSHVRSILLKLGVSSQLAAVAVAHRSNWKPDSLAGSGRT